MTTLTSKESDKIGSKPRLLSIKGTVVNSTGCHRQGCNNLVNFGIDPNTSQIQCSEEQTNIN